MQPSTDNNDLQMAESLFKQPGAIFGERQWSYLKERYHLTSREVQVAILVCQGYDNDNISHILGIQQGTVKTHVRNVYRRVRVKNKISLLLKFLGDINTMSQDIESNKDAEGVTRIEEVAAPAPEPAIQKTPTKL